MVESVECSNCGATEVFLRKKNSAIGLYCLGCGKWYKWVNKKSVEAYKHKGYKVNNEDWTPTTSTEPLTPTSTPKDNTNSSLMQFSRPLEDSDSSDLGDAFITETKSTNALKRNSVPANIGVTADKTTKELEQVKQEVARDISPCHVCVSGVIDPMTKTDDARITIFDGVMTVRSIKMTKAHGFFQIKYCPGCGKKL
jgi:hypothetical protein